MTLTVPVRETRRVMSQDEADALVGSYVPELAANVHEAGVWYDVDTDEPILAYVPLTEGKEALRNAVRAIKMSQTVRQTTGMRNDSRTFGMAPRKPYQKRESCKATSMSYENPESHAVLVALAKTCADILNDLVPAQYQSDVSAIRDIDNAWRITDDALWTSGVVNKSSSLPYHRDGFNFATWSAMPVVRRHMDGGYLNIPEYDLTVSCRDGWVVLFAGYKYVHGVTPMRVTRDGGYRFSIVYYALKGMKDCFTYAVETAKARERRTEREEHLAKVLKGEAEFRVSAGVAKLTALRKTKQDISVKSV